MRWLVSFAGGLLVVLMVIASSKLVTSLAAVELARRFQSEEALTQAIELDPTRPELYRQRAEVRQNDLRVQSYQLAGQDLAEATRLNPYYWKYWNDLARYYERIGNMTSAEETYRKAVQLSPLSGLYHWSLFNFLLRQSRIDDALSELKQALRLDEQLRDIGLDMLVQLDIGPDRLLAIWPSDRQATLSLLSLCNRPQPDGRLNRVLLAAIDRYLGFDSILENPVNQVVNYFLRRKQSEEAKSIWIRYQQKMGFDAPEYASEKNFVWNGGFEFPLSKGTLGWDPDLPPSLRADREAYKGFQSSVGLRIRIDGRQREPSGPFLRQRIPLPPGDYLLSVRHRVESRRTQGHLKLVLIQLNNGRSAAIDLTARGAVDWKESRQRTTIGPGADVELRLEGASASSGISMTFWIDDIRLAAE